MQLEQMQKLFLLQYFYFINFSRLGVLGFWGSRLVQHDLDGLVVASPSPLRMHPAVEAGFVGVHDDFLLLQPCCKVDAELESFLILGQPHALLVAVRGPEVLDALPVVEALQC